MVRSVYQIIGTHRKVRSQAIRQVSLLVWLTYVGMCATSLADISTATTTVVSTARGSGSRGELVLYAVDLADVPVRASSIIVTLMALQYQFGFADEPPWYRLDYWGSYSTLLSDLAGHHPASLLNNSLRRRNGQLASLSLRLHKLLLSLHVEHAGLRP
ncbi:hypothetical protein EDB84DRAFT_781936 [Lactarius hengduanensis]|nr:hypothetical protein EDB84DRAFT_781936 [Lactarius hengduanensis]